ncbi:uncharacterized protein LOC123712364 [Pieris brassicae]|uniref:Uncharacterized protein n=1 Tax=Pieris brassicae TaxID=7116 RepID=A0A9P0T922_PIEBR|nr:uncharacterized protein LOC123712364 [Pieris brassicae]CAH3999054.1 unnamed protein product [Pieris brassicae]
MNLENQVSLCGIVPACSIQTSVSQASGDLFSDSNCGEPLLSQRIVLDFTPDEALDQDFVQRKCVAFWECVERNPDLQNLGTCPDYNVFDKNTSTPSSSYAMKKEFTIDKEDKAKTAVSMLELVENKGLIDRAFEGKLPQSYCSFGEDHYSAKESIAITQKKGLEGDEKQNKKYSSRGALKKLCLKLDDWNTGHPRYMKPPGHSQTLLTCKRRKNVS